MRTCLCGPAWAPETVAALATRLLQPLQLLPLQANLSPQNIGSSMHKLELNPTAPGRWGQGIDDVSILRRLQNVEVLSLSINHISSLRPFGHCKALRELYLRKNEVALIEELRFLARLPNLQVGWWMHERMSTCCCMIVHAWLCVHTCMVACVYIQLLVHVLCV